MQVLTTAPYPTGDYSTQALAEAPHPTLLKELATGAHLLHPDPLQRTDLPTLMTALAAITFSDTDSTLLPPQSSPPPPPQQQQQLSDSTLLPPQSSPPPPQQQQQLSDSTLLPPQSSPPPPQQQQQRQTELLAMLNELRGEGEALSIQQPQPQPQPQQPKQLMLPAGAGGTTSAAEKDTQHQHVLPSVQQSLCELAKAIESASRKFKQPPSDARHHAGRRSHPAQHGARVGSLPQRCDVEPTTAPVPLAAVGNAPELAVGNAPELAVGNEPELAAAAAPATATPAVSPAASPAASFERCVEHETGKAQERCVEQEAGKAQAPLACCSTQRSGTGQVRCLPRQAVCRSREGSADHGTGWVQSTDSRSSEIKRDHSSGWVQSTDASSSDDAYSSSLDLSSSAEGRCVTLPNRHEHLAYSKDLASIEYFQEISRVRAFTM